MRWRRRRAAEGTATEAADEKPGEGPKQQAKPVKAPKGRGPSINQGRKGPAVNNRPKKNADATGEEEFLRKRRIICALFDLRMHW